jgi:hypothetical protein
MGVNQMDLIPQANRQPDIQPDLTLYAGRQPSIRLDLPLHVGQQSNIRPDLTLHAGQQPNIRVEIEALVLEGFEARQAGRIAAALESELSRLLQEEGEPEAWASSQEVAQLEVAPIQISPRHSPEAIGAQAARAIYRGLQR